VPAPVMVFLHGGGLVAGSGSDALYEGRNLAEATGRVVVTLNYRLGPLGFLAHPDLDSEGPPQGSGNYGVLDQIAALDFIKRNIGAFGGDKSQVVLFGESAGGISVCAQLLSPLAVGLFSAAIMESGPCDLLATP